MDEFPSNSREQRSPAPKSAPKAEPKNIERVTVGEVVQRKKPWHKRLAETFVGGDTKSVFGYVAMDVLVPAAKDMAADAVSQGIERMLFGEARSTSRRTGAAPGGFGHIAYNRYSSNKPAPAEPRRDISRRGRATHDFDEIILSTRAEAEEVIDRLFDLVSKYNFASVSDLYELVGVTGKYTDQKWGWSDIRGAAATRVRNGYLLDLPRPEPLD